jgi:hypothetical protein
MIPLAALLLVSASVGRAQQSPVAAMFNDDQKRDKNLAASFLVVEFRRRPRDLPCRCTSAPAICSGHSNRPEFRPDSAVVPTNVELQIDAPSPATQRVLMDRVRKAPDVLRDLQEQNRGAQGHVEHRRRHGSR